MDLCRDAGISRATFYEHFQDVFAVATWMWDHLMSTTLYQMGITLDCYTAHLRKFEALLRHKEFFENAMRIVGYPSICQHGGRMVYEHMEETFERKARRPLTPHEALELEFFNTGAKHMTRHWVERGMVEPPTRWLACSRATCPQTRCRAAWSPMSRPLPGRRREGSTRAMGGDDRGR